MFKAHRTHEFHMGHRILGHQGKCIHPHGHSYVATFYIESPELDELGMVIDFSVIKEKIINWVEENYDHKFMVFFEDPFSQALLKADPTGTVVVGFNPTAENIAYHLLYVVGPEQFAGTGVVLRGITLMETSKCGVTLERTSEIK